MTYQSGVEGIPGDVEWHTTTHVEQARFYATATAIRDTDFFEYTHAMMNDQVCHYGRASNQRTCLHYVTAIEQCVTFEGKTICNMVRASGQPGDTQDKDSGGGWSYSTTAYGIHRGKDESETLYFFTGIEAMEDALNVTIKLQ